MSKLKGAGAPKLGEKGTALGCGRLLEVVRRSPKLELGLSLGLQVRWNFRRKSPFSNFHLSLLKRCQDKQPLENGS